MCSIYSRVHLGFMKYPVYNPSDMIPFNHDTLDSILFFSNSPNPPLSVYIIMVSEISRRTETVSPFYFFVSSPNELILVKHTVFAMFNQTLILNVENRLEYRSQEELTSHLKLTQT